LRPVPPLFFWDRMNQREVSGTFSVCRQGHRWSFPKLWYPLQMPSSPP